MGNAETPLRQRTTTVVEVRSKRTTAKLTTVLTVDEMDEVRTMFGAGRVYPVEV